jgi:hypothetical protein
MQIRLSEPEALPELMDALSQRVDFIVKAIPPDRVVVSVLGSFRDGGEDELRRFLRESNAAVDAQVSRDEQSPASLLPFPEPTA